MRGVNKVIIIGNLGRDPEVRYLPNGNAVANITVATSESWKDKNTGAMNEVTEWHRIIFYGRLAEIAGEYLRKGSKVFLEGSLHTRKWQDKATGQDRYSTEIKGSNLQMLDTKGSGQRDNFDDGDLPPYAGTQPAAPQQRQPAAPAPADDWDDDSIPF